MSINHLAPYMYIHVRILYHLVNPILDISVSEVAAVQTAPRGGGMLQPSCRPPPP